MRISEMILREDFYTILQKTIIDYYKVVFDVDVIFSYDKHEGKSYIINSKLGFISCIPTPKGLREFLLSEYNIRNNILKFVVGKIVVCLICAFPKIGSVRNCYISCDLIKRNWFIYPQNRSIRFFDYENMTVDCIIKSGFTDKYFKNQLEFRKKYSYNFMLPLLDYGDSWFREPILQGHPLARVTDSNAFNKGINDALAGIKKLALDTYEEIDANHYIQFLKNQIFEKYEKAVISKDVTCKSVVSQMLDIVDNLKPNEFIVPLCVGHGDFQSGNIWVDKKGKTWIYDWETSGKRSVWYDIAVLKYSLRREYGWKLLVDKTDISDVLVCDKNKKYNDRQYSYIKGIILLEDLLFYLDDMLELPSNWGKDIFEHNISNISEAIVGRNCL